jgi:hypothetical protein
VIAYDKDLPEIPGRLPWLKPDAHLLRYGIDLAVEVENRELKVKSEDEQWILKN